MFGKRAAQEVRVWTCTISNRGPEPLVVSEGTILRGMNDAGIGAHSADLVRLIAGEKQRLGPWKTLGRIFKHLAKGAALVAGAGFINMSDDLRLGIVLGGESLPDLGAAFSSRAPSLENFERLAWTEQLGVERHSDISVSMFSGPWDGPPVVKGVLDAERPAVEPAAPAAVPARLTFERVIWPSAPRLRLARF